MNIKTPFIQLYLKNCIKKMPMKGLFIFLAFFTTVSLYGQDVLRIEINELKNNDGHILLELSNHKSDFIKGVSKEIENKKCIIIINDLSPGKYSFKYFHDENNNKELDTNWIGIPTEGFGFSNNARGTFGPPNFEKTIFEIKGNVTKKCIPKYY